MPHLSLVWPCLMGRTWSQRVPRTMGHRQRCSCTRAHRHTRRMPWWPGPSPTEHTAQSYTLTHLIWSYTHRHVQSPCTTYSPITLTHKHPSPMCKYYGSKWFIANFRLNANKTLHKYTNMNIYKLYMCTYYSYI